MSDLAKSSSATFYTDHWKVIEAERLARYEQMFVWRPEQAAPARTRRNRRRGSAYSTSAADPAF